jgi:ATP-binding cassette subfamily C protein CydC
MSELRPYLRLLAAYRGRLLAGSALMLLAIAASIGLLALSGWFITATAIAGLAIAAGVGVMFDVYVPGGAIRAFALTRTIARYFERLWNHDAILRLLADLRSSAFAQLTRLDPATLARFRSAELLNRLTADIDALDTLYLRALAPPLVALLALIGVGALLAVFAPATGLLVFATLGVAALLVLLLAWRAGGSAGEAVSAATERLRDELLDSLRGLAEWRAFGQHKQQQARVARGSETLLRRQAALATRAAMAEQAIGLLTQIAAVLTLFIALLLYHEGSISGPVAVLMTLAVLGLGEVLLPLPASMLHLGRSRAAARRLNPLMRLRSAVVDTASPSAFPSTLRLQFDQLRYQPDPIRAPVLDGVSLQIAAGESVALLGASGAGKSSVAGLCARMADPQAGEVSLGGIPLRQLSLAELHSRIGYLTQRSDLFADTIAANLRLGKPEADEAALWRALQIADLDDFVRGLPQGLETWIGESALQLSGGQARRLALARVLLRDAPVVLLDEPLSGLDADTASRVATRLSTWLRGRTALLLAHEQSALPNVDRVLRLRDGCIIRDE